MWDGIGGMRALDAGAGPRQITIMMTAMMRRPDRLDRPLRRLLGRDLGVGGGLLRTGIGITDVAALLDPEIEDDTATNLTTHLVDVAQLLRSARTAPKTSNTIIIIIINTVTSPS